MWLGCTDPAQQGSRKPRQHRRALALALRKARLKRLFRRKVVGLLYSDHVVRNGPQFRAQACKLGLEGAISKRPIDRMCRVTVGSG
ncbi:hypothetical protein RSO01_76150 [Reyranella soli]|uniref:Uncharacterized protein n=1 Tax=Reyranella soli TaxID=1230389 RepID=A0A512NNE1_9HYPH|nr:hypothetical protein RSO01_76150 [Reyranella soli]